MTVKAKDLESYTRSEAAVACGFEPPAKCERDDKLDERFMEMVRYGAEAIPQKLLMQYEARELTAEILRRAFRAPLFQSSTVATMGDCQECVLARAAAADAGYNVTAIPEVIDRLKNRAEICDIENAALRQEIIKLSPSATARTTEAGSWLPLLEMFPEDQVLLHGAAGEDAMNVGDVVRFVRELAVMQENAQRSATTVETFNGDEPAILVAASYIKRLGARQDWACADCVPHSDCLKSGFRCYYHQAVELLERTDHSQSDISRSHQEKP